MLRRIGVVGYGRVGQYLAREIQAHPDLELAFVWNRTASAIPAGLPRLDSLDDIADAGADLIAEMAHPSISKQYATTFLQHADYMAGSPTAFADRELETAIQEAAAIPNGHGVYVPKGALPGMGDVLEMAADGRLHSASITMRKEPTSLKWYGPLDRPLAEITQATEIFRGTVRELCPLAPNNVNTMAILALASGLGLDAVEARFVVDPALTDHIVEVELRGPPREDGSLYRLQMRRINPAAKGAVTGSATYRSFFNSLLRSHGAGDGMHFR
jgi:predicted dinucleotide-utilizing enzyme